MSRHQKRHQWSPYTSDIRRLSIYPQINAREERPIREGDSLVVNIYDIDEKGRGIVDYKGVKILIPNAMSGSRVKVRIVRVQGDTAVGQIVRILSESAD